MFPTDASTEPLIPSDLATFETPTPFTSCFRTFRSAVDLRPAELHALSDGAFEARLHALSDHAALEFRKGAGYLGKPSLPIEVVEPILLRFIATTS